MGSCTVRSAVVSLRMRVFKFLLSVEAHKQGGQVNINMSTEYNIRTDWDAHGERYTVLKNNRVVIITRCRSIITKWFPLMWMDTSGIPDVVGI
jgi:hypothetical protein